MVAGAPSLRNKDSSPWTSECSAALNSYAQWDVLQCLSLITKDTSPAKAAGIKGNDLKWLWFSQSERGV